jgi:hypothetical protein
MPRRPLKEVMPPEVPETSPSKPAPAPAPEPVTTEATLSRFSSVVVRGVLITKKEYDEARKGNVKVKRDFGFVVEDKDGWMMSYFHYPKANSYFKGIYMSNPDEFNKEVVSYDVSLILSDRENDQQAA